MYILNVKCVQDLYLSHCNESVFTNCCFDQTLKSVGLFLCEEV